MTLKTPCGDGRCRKPRRSPRDLALSTGMDHSPENDNRKETGREPEYPNQEGNQGRHFQSVGTDRERGRLRVPAPFQA